MAKRREMSEFRISELSAVDRPAQAHAKMTIMKRDGGTVVHEDIIKAWLDPADGAKPFTDFLESSAECKSFYDATEAVYPVISALDSSIRSVVGDKDLPVFEKESMLRNSVEEFLASIRSKWPDVEAAFSKLLTDEPESLNKRSPEMSDKNEVTVEGLQKKLTELTEKLAASTADIEKLTAEKAEADALLKMSDSEREWVATLSADDKKKAMASTPEERKKLMAKAADNDEVIKVDGNEVRKSVVGDVQFSVFKSLAAKNDALEKQAMADREALAKANFEKRAEDELHHLPGDTVAKGAVLKAVSTLDEGIRKDLDAMLKAGEAAIKAGFQTIGHQNGLTQKAAGDFQKRVSEIAARDKISKTEAMQKARKEYPEEFAAFQGTGQQAN